MTSPDRRHPLDSQERIDHGAVVDASAVPLRLRGGGRDLQLRVAGADGLPAEVGRARRRGRVEDPAATAIQELRTIGMELDRAAILVDIAVVERTLCRLRDYAA